MLAKVNIYANRLHAIKRYMDRRNLPGIPQESPGVILH